jgi:hypothetical protein
VLPNILPLDFAKQFPAIRRLRLAIRRLCLAIRRPRRRRRRSQAAAKLPMFFQLLLQRYWDVVNSSKVLPASSHGVLHYLKTTGLPNALPFRRLGAEKLAAAKADFMKMEAEGIIRRSSSPWASLLHLFKKPDGSWQACGNFRRLNNVTVPNIYPLPNMMDLSARVTGCKFFS